MDLTYPRRKLLSPLECFPALLWPPVSCARAKSGKVAAKTSVEVTKIVCSMKYEKINLEDYTQTGEGGQALTYTRKDGSAMAKMFVHDQGIETVEREFMISKAVYDAGIPCPKPIRLVTDGERFGAEYEVVANKRSYTRIISEEPEQLERTPFGKTGAAG